eukprot:1191591-Prorocentrum_minimum.AAC.4
MCAHLNDRRKLVCVVGRPCSKTPLLRLGLVSPCSTCWSVGRVRTAPCEVNMNATSPVTRSRRVCANSANVPLNA